MGCSGGGRKRKERYRERAEEHKKIGRRDGKGRVEEEERDVRIKHKKKKKSKKKAITNEAQER